MEICLYYFPKHRLYCNFDGKCDEIFSDFSSTFPKSYLVCKFSWKPRVVILDYLQLLLSEYTQQWQTASNSTYIIQNIYNFDFCNDILCSEHWTSEKLYHQRNQTMMLYNGLCVVYIYVCSHKRKMKSSYILIYYSTNHICIYRFLCIFIVMSKQLQVICFSICLYFVQRNQM